MELHTVLLLYCLGLPFLGTPISNNDILQKNGLKYYLQAKMNIHFLVVFLETELLLSLFYHRHKFSY